MQASALNYDVVALGRRRAHQTMHDAKGITEHTLGFRFVHRAVPFLLARLFGGKLEAAHCKLLDQAVWFRGAKEAIEQPSAADGILDSELRMQILLEATEGAIVEVRAAVQNLMSHTSIYDSEQAEVWHDLCRKVESSSEELLQAVGEFKWALAEHDATFATHSAGFSASTKEELDSLLDRLLSV